MEDNKENIARIFQPVDAKDKVNLVIGWQNRFMMIT